MLILCISLFLVFFSPLALYLLVLGNLNSRRHPIFVPGTWDFVGLLLALSGFLTVGGPAVISGLHDRWRLSWLSGGEAEGAQLIWNSWIISSLLYFLVVVVGVALLLRYQRHLTSVYNVEPTGLHTALTEVCKRLGLTPARSGNVYVFNVASDEILKIQAPSTGIQTALPLAPANAMGPTVILEAESFPMMRHVTLSWEPVRSALRQEVEGELANTLSETLAKPNDVGAWLGLAGITLLGANLLALFALVLFQKRWF